MTEKAALAFIGFMAAPLTGVAALALKCLHGAKNYGYAFIALMAATSTSC